MMKRTMETKVDSAPWTIGSPSETRQSTIFSSGVGAFDVKYAYEMWIEKSTLNPMPMISRIIDTGSRFTLHRDMYLNHQKQIKFISSFSTAIVVFESF